MTDLFERIREDFPRARTMAYFDNASSHPISVHSAAAPAPVRRLGRATRWGSRGGRLGHRRETKPRPYLLSFINADSGEIAFARSTVESESNILNGLRDHSGGRQCGDVGPEFQPLHIQLQVSRAARSRCADRQEPQLANRYGRHGRRGRWQYPADFSGIGVKRQWVCRRCCGAEQAGSRQRRLSVCRYHAGPRAAFRSTSRRWALTLRLVRRSSG